MTIDEILEKAFTSGDLAPGGMLNPEQAAEFVQGVIDNSIIIHECRREPMKAKKKQIDKITYTGNVLQKPPSVGTAPTTTSKPSTSKVELDSQETIVAVDVGYDALEDNIEGKGLYNTIMELTNKKVALELDILLLHGDTAGGTADYLEILDGAFKQLTTNICDATEATLDPSVLFAALKKLPSKYFDSPKNFRFYVSHIASLDYVDALAGKGVNEAFVRYLIEAQEPAYRGIAVREVPAIQTEEINTTGPVYGSKGLLVNPKNIIWGVHRDIQYEFQKQPRKRVIEVTMTMRIDVKLEEEIAGVKITKIKHS